MKLYVKEYCNSKFFILLTIYYSNTLSHYSKALKMYGCSD